MLTPLSRSTGSCSGRCAAAEAATTDRRLTCQLAFEPRGSDKEVHSEGLFLGSPEELERMLAPWCQAAQPLEGYPQVRSMSFLESTRFFASFDNPSPHPFKTTGAFVYENLPDAALKTLVHYLNTAPSSKCFLWMQSFGGAFADKAPEDTAFFHRKARFIFEYGSVWEKPSYPIGPQCIEWVRNFRQDMAEYTRGTYVNFVDLDLSANGAYLDMYYGGNVQRLREIKTRVDPEDLFRFEQSLPLLPEATSKAR